MILAAGIVAVNSKEPIRVGFSLLIFEATISSDVSVSPSLDNLDLIEVGKAYDPS